MHSVRLAAALLFSHLFSPARNTASGFPLTFSPCSEPSPSVFSSLAIITLPRKSAMWFSSCLRNHFVFLSFHCTVHPFTCFHTFIFSFSVLSWVNSHIHKKELWKMRDDNCESATVKKWDIFSPHTTSGLKMQYISLLLSEVSQCRLLSGVKSSNMEP